MTALNLSLSMAKALNLYTSQTCCSEYFKDDYQDRKEKERKKSEVENSSERKRMREKVFFLCKLRLKRLTSLCVSKDKRCKPK